MTTTPDTAPDLPDEGPSDGGPRRSGLLLSLDPPAEPPVGSVCVDRFGRAWQRRKHGLLPTETVWCPAVTPDETRAPVLAVSWAVLLGESGPALLAYETTEDQDPATAEAVERHARATAAWNTVEEGR